jgi:transcriptional regulator with XRE-family HTH domain
MKASTSSSESKLLGDGAQGPGALLRALRSVRGWTLADVSERTGVQVSTLSKLETGRMSFSYDKLMQISHGLELDVTELLSPKASVAASAKSAGRRSISRAGEGVVVESKNYTYRHVATELLNRQFAPMIGEIHARSLEEFGEFSQHPGEEFIYVLEGSMDLHTTIYAPLRLEQGDSLYFDSDMPHAYIAIGPGPCRILSICADSEKE